MCQVSFCFLYSCTSGLSRFQDNFCFALATVSYLQQLQGLTCSCKAGSTPWAQSYARKKLPRAAELTLEKVYAKWRHPPSNIIDSLWDLHQIPR